MNILFLIAAFVLVFMVVRLLLKTPDVKRPKHPQQVSSGHMLRCEYCGLHVPENEAVKEGPRAFCSNDHRDLALAQESTRE
ncbi:MULTISPECIES: PP0621 family protein [Ectothiorhodospira]|uniref:Preprotein translocase subunit YajC n=1 Tax=Ectothiorhodospira marina TaxID=1396821 RepID=A0A1H7HFA2_9GAMM|nr:MULTISPECIES: PP0621 family protein [Ectothiorhodospira]MCG5515057.1 hypothetical protein [Ectothiorhodospira sp. 9100]MCG5517775.1 hypothetical protein [Ectothiorhodospira sp. 9905]SEK48112.1 uncharacterized protein SAMN05444515_102131 [Ectothiorhodospira marina]